MSIFNQNGNGKSYCAADLEAGDLRRGSGKGLDFGQISSHCCWSHRRLIWQGKSLGSNE